ncbi:MAG: hypothetical protein ACT4NY_08535 [Pseudonocardiales bacterium]
MTGQEVTVEQLLRSIRDDWALAQTIRRKVGARLAHVKRRGVPWRRIAAETAIPMTMVRRYATPHLADGEPDGRSGAW